MVVLLQFNDNSLSSRHRRLSISRCGAAGAHILTQPAGLNMCNGA